MSSQTSVTWLLASVRRRSYQPVSGGPSSADLCAQLSEELLNYTAPLLATIGEEFFVAKSRFSTEAGTGAYDIPTDSIASKIRDVQRLKDGGDADNDSDWVSLAHEEPERAIEYASTATNPHAYFVRGDQIVILPTPNGVTSMRMLYYRRPRNIVSTGYSVASGVSGTTTRTVTVASTSGMTTGDFDILDSTTYARIENGTSIPGTVASGTTLTFTAADLTTDQLAALDASTGDTWVNSGDAPVADVPPEAAILLAQRTAAVLLQMQGSPRMAQAFTELERQKLVVQNLFAPRTSGRARKIVNRAAAGWGRWRFRGWGGGFGAT